MKKKSRSNELNQAIRKAALTVDPNGRISVLARLCRVTPEAIRGSIRRGYFSPGLASSIETAVGRQVLSREALCPEKFSKQGDA